MNSKSWVKRDLRFFWTKEWSYERTPEQWIELSNVSWVGAKVLDTLKRALHKLALEKKITAEEQIRLWEMINSPDQENAILAVNIMAKLKPKKFKRVLTTNN